MIGVAARLAELAAADAAPTGHDAMAAVTLFYRGVAVDILDRLDTGEGLGSREFFHDLSVLSATRYLTVAQGVAARRPLPQAWQMLLEHRFERDITTAVFTTAAMHTHLGYDLPQAAVRTATLHGRPLGSSQHLDYTALSAIIRDRLARLARPGPAERRVTGAETGRRDAQHMWTLRGQPHRSALEWAEIDWRVEQIGREILESAPA